MVDHPVLPDGGLVFIGLGEAAFAFAEGMGAQRPASRGYDLDPAKAARFEAFGLAPCRANAEAVSGAAAILCLVTADQALAAARQSAQALAPGALYLDGNSVAPQTKRAAAEAVEAAGGRYVDVAIMSPVRPATTGAPLLLSGAHAEDAAGRLRAWGFSKVRVLPGPVGAASAVKMIRSIMVKGVEALTAECLTAAVAAGVDEEVLASLDASRAEQPWAERGDYNLDRMMVHGVRRAAEMREVEATLQALGVAAPMTQATIAWQDAIGGAGVDPLPAGYWAKAAKLRELKAQP